MKQVFTNNVITDAFLLLLLYIYGKCFIQVQHIIDHVIFILLIVNANISGAKQHNRYQGLSLAVGYQTLVEPGQVMEAP